MAHSYTPAQLAWDLGVSVQDVQVAARELGYPEGPLYVVYTARQADLIRRYLLQYLTPHRVRALRDGQAEELA